MWAAIGRWVAGALVGEQTVKAKGSLLQALLEVEDAQLQALNGLDRKLDILIDAPFKAGRDELEAAQRAWRTPVDQERLLESARRLFVQARASAPDAARAAVYDWYVALCWLGLGHPQDARAALERSRASTREAIYPARRAYLYADSRQEPGTWSTWREWRDRLWPKDEDEVERIRHRTRAQLNALCDLSRGSAEIARALGDTHGLGRYSLVGAPKDPDGLTLVAEHLPGEVALLHELEVTLFEPRRLPRRPWAAMDVEVHNTSEDEGGYFIARFDLAPEPWSASDAWPRLEPPQASAETDPAQVRKTGAIPLTTDGEDGAFSLEPGETRRGTVLLPRKPAPRTVLLHDVVWVDALAFVLD